MCKKKCYCFMRIMGLFLWRFMFLGGGWGRMVREEVSQYSFWEVGVCRSGIRVS